MVGRDQALHLTPQPLLAPVVLVVRAKAMAAGMRNEVVVGTVAACRSHHSRAAFRLSERLLRPSDLLANSRKPLVCLWPGRPSLARRLTRGAGRLQSPSVPPPRRFSPTRLVCRGCASGKAGRYRRGRSTLFVSPALARSKFQWSPLGDQS